jgi:hypothetical protein
MLMIIICIRMLITGLTTIMLKEQEVGLNITWPKQSYAVVTY